MVVRVGASGDVADLGRRHAVRRPPPRRAGDHGGLELEDRRLPLAGGVAQGGERPADDVDAVGVPPVALDQAEAGPS